MHIPDGLLSPTTAVIGYAAITPIWTLAGRNLRRTLGARQTPLLAMGAAFCFCIMMFNIPALGGTTAHPVAGTLLAILLGPWAALIGVTVSLGIQALFFADGGVLAFGANCFTMAFVLPFVGYSVYRLIGGRSKATSPWRAVAAGIGSYVGLNIAAVVVAILLGLQPVLFHEPNGHALYFPFGLRITLPAMLGTHLLVAGPAEAIVTAFVVRYLQIAGFSLYGADQQSNATSGDLQPDLQPGRVRIEGLIIGLLTIVALTPLGLLAKGDAWGEWDSQTLAAKAGYVSKGYVHAEETGYKGIKGLSNYAQPDQGKSNLGYIGAAALGGTVIVVLLLIIGQLLAQRKDNSDEGGPSESKVRTPTATSHGGNTLPDWMYHSIYDSRNDSVYDSNEEPVHSSTSGGRRSNSFLEKTLSELADGVSATIMGEKYAHSSGYLQQLDPRAKIVGFFALILVTASVHHLTILVVLYGLVPALAYGSRIPLMYFTKRVWMAAPLFVGLIAVPACLNIVTPGPTLIALWRHPYIAITTSGLLSAVILIVRAGVAVAFGALLTMSTRWNDLLRSLRALLVPRLFVTVLTVTYRYLMLLLLTAEEMFVARRSRTLGRASNAESRRFVGTSIGALFGKTLLLAEETHAAMLSRGFNGDIRTMTRFHWRYSDSIWTLSIVVIAIIAFGGDHVRIW